MRSLESRVGMTKEQEEEVRRVFREGMQRPLEPNVFVLPMPIYERLMRELGKEKSDERKSEDRIGCV